MEKRELKGEVEKIVTHRCQLDSMITILSLFDAAEGTLTKNYTIKSKTSLEW